MEIFSKVVLICLVSCALGMILYGVIKVLSQDGYLGKYLQFTLGSVNKYSKEGNAEVKSLLNDYDAGRVEISCVDNLSITFTNGKVLYTGNRYFSYGYIFNFAPWKGSYRCSWEQAKRIMKIEKEFGIEKERI